MPIVNNKPVVFQFVAVWHPTEEQAKAGQKSKIIVPVGAVLSRDQQTALITAAQQIPAEYKDQFDQIEIAINDF